MSIAPIVNILTQLLAAVLPLAPLVGALAVAWAGFLFMTGSHGKGRESLISAVLGIVIMLGSQTIATSIHP